MFYDVGITVVGADDMLYAASEISQRLQTGNHVERHWKRVADVDVVHPQSSPCKFPLHITVSLYISPHRITH